MANTKQIKASKVAAYKRVFESPDGRMILADLMLNFSVFGTTFMAGERDSVIFNEGARNTVLYIMEMTHLTADEVDRMYTDARTSNLQWGLPDAKRETENPDDQTR